MVNARAYDGDVGRSSRQKGGWMNEQEFQQELQDLRDQVRRVQQDNAQVMNEIVKRAQWMQNAINDLANIAFYLSAKAENNAKQAEEVVA